MPWTLSSETYIERCRKRHGSYYLYDKTKYVHSHQFVTVTCPEHGDFEVQASAHSRGVGCRMCFYNRITFSTELFVTKSKEIHGERYLYHEAKYTNAQSSVKIVCRVHGEFEQLAKHHLTGRGCDQCARCRSTTSKVETRWLDALGVDQKYRQKHLTIGKKIFKVDAYVPETNTVYEFYGDYWHGNPEFYPPSEINPSSRKTYGVLFAETKQREETLKSEGYSLVTIWESEFWCLDGTGTRT